MLLNYFFSLICVLLQRYAPAKNYKGERTLVFLSGFPDMKELFIIIIILLLFIILFCLLLFCHNNKRMEAQPTPNAQHSLLSITSHDMGLQEEPAQIPGKPIVPSCPAVFPET